MSDENEPITAVAKAVEESAKTGRALIEAGSSLASFVGKALDTAAEDTIGLLGVDYLRHLRIRNLDKIVRKTEETLRARGVEDPEQISPKALLQDLEAASEEADETLRDMWANLLANSMDPNKDTSLQHIFIDTLKQMEPIDALILRETAGKSPKLSVDVKDLASRLNRRETLVTVSGNRLADLGIVSVIKTQGGGYDIISALGMELYLACQSDVPD